MLKPLRNQVVLKKYEEENSQLQQQLDQKEKETMMERERYEKE